MESDEGGARRLSLEILYLVATVAIPSWLHAGMWHEACHVACGIHPAGQCLGVEMEACHANGNGGMPMQMEA